LCRLAGRGFTGANRPAASSAAQVVLPLLTCLTRRR
jgi:hypothetical protein